jgi:protein-tyrosine kinase
MSRIHEALQRANGEPADAIVHAEPPPYAWSPVGLEPEPSPSTPPVFPAERGAAASLLSTEWIEYLEPEEDAASAAATGAEKRGAAKRPLTSEKLIIAAEASAVVVEQYRNIGAALHRAQTEQGLKIVMVVSAVPEEGKTFAAANVALTLSESYRRRVLLIDSDLRHPQLHDLLGVPNVSGWNDALTGESPRMRCRRLTDTLYVMTAGRPDPNPMRVLTAERMAPCLARLTAAFDWIVIDTSPAGNLPDVSLLAPHVDGALLVVRAGSTPLPTVQRAIHAIGHDRILGVVLNRVEQGVLDQNQYSPYFGGHVSATGRG